MKVKYLHTMVRVKNIEESKKFYCDLLGLKEIKRKESEEGKFTLVFLAAPNQEDIALELTYNWNTNEIYSEGRWTKLVWKPGDERQAHGLTF